MDRVIEAEKAEAEWRQRASRWPLSSLRARFALWAAERCREKAGRELLTVSRGGRPGWSASVPVKNDPAD